MPPEAAEAGVGWSAERGSWMWTLGLRPTFPWVFHGTVDTALASGPGPPSQHTGSQWDRLPEAGVGGQGSQKVAPQAAGVCGVARGPGRLTWTRGPSGASGTPVGHRLARDLLEVPDACVSSLADSENFKKPLPSRL